MPSPLPPASEILARVRQVYRECASYEDTGEVVSVYRPTKGLLRRKRKHVRRFETAFVRPDRFRFEFTEHGYGYEHASGRYVIWNDGSGVRSWWTVKPEVKEHPALTDAVRNAVGVSGRSSMRVADLLLAADDSGEASMARIDRVERTECHVIAVTYAEDRDERLWIARDSGLIVRVEWEHVLDARSREQARLATEQMPASDEVPEAMKVRVRASMERMASRDQPDTKVTTTTTYRPTIDAQIEPDRFAFTPPFVGPSPSP